MRVNSSKAKLFSCVVLTTALFLITTLPTLAQENIISSVVISKARNSSGYELNIDSTQAVSYKTKFENEDSVVFELKNSTLAPEAATYYDDVTDIDSVAVKQEKNNRVNIYLQGKNAQDTELVFVNSVFEQTAQPSKSVTINRPINQYQPTSRFADLDEQGEMQDWDDNSFNLGHLSSSLFANLKDGAMGIVMIFLAILALMAIVVKNVSKRYEQDSEPLIGLSNNLNIQSKIPARVVDNELPNIERRSEALKAAQEQLTRAHQKYQDYLKEKYKNNYQEKLNSVGIDAVKKGIALSQYQKSTQNPYKDQPVLKMNKDFTQKTYANNDFKIPSRPQRETGFSSPYIQRPSNKIDYMPKQSKNTSMKFLESVSKIYENSGRGDLANGLKNTMMKAKQSS